MERRSFLSRLLAGFSLAAPATALATVKASEPNEYVWVVDVMVRKDGTDWVGRHLVWSEWTRIGEYQSYDDAFAVAGKFFEIPDMALTEFECFDSKIPIKGTGEWVLPGDCRILRAKRKGLGSSGSGLSSLQSYAEQAFGDPHKVNYRRPSWAEVQKKMRRA